MIIHFPTHLNSIPLIFICQSKVSETIMISLYHRVPSFKLNHVICQFYTLKNGQASTITLVPSLCITKYTKKHYKKENQSLWDVYHRQRLQLLSNRRKERTRTVPDSFATLSRLSHSSKGPRHLARKVWRATQSKGNTRSSAPTRKMGSTTM